MSVSEQIKRIKNNIQASYTALADKGATLPTNQNSDNLASTIANLEVGGSGGNDEVLKGIVEGTATDIVLPDNVEKIANRFFYKSNSHPFAKGINSIKASGVTELGEYALGSQKLKSIEFPNLKIIGDYGLSTGASSNNGYSSTEKIILGKLEKVGKYGFNGLFNYDGITPEIEMSFNNCEIGDYAFKYYNYPSFDGTGVKSLGEQVFNYVNKNFKKVWFPSTIETVTGSTMFRLYSNFTITIYTDVPDENSVPEGWGTGWCAKYSGGNGVINVVYGATYEDFLNA